MSCALVAPSLSAIANAATVHGQRGTFPGYVTPPDQEGRDYYWQMTFSKEVVDMMRLAPLLFISMVVAIPGLLVLGFVDSPMPIHVTMLATAAVWLVLLIAALVIHGKRGLWLLVGAPFALFIPLVWAHLYFVCECSIFQEG